MTQSSQGTSKPQVGFIGVGLMGHGMAKNIVEKGWPLTVTAHSKREAVDDLVGRGATEAADIAALAAACDVIFICVSASPQVEGVMRGPGGIIANAKPGTIVVDCSTADPVSTKTLAAEAAVKGITLIDAPLGRTPKEAWEGKLDCMVGADEATLAAVRPLLEAWAGRVIHIGGVGAGHTMKLINNFLSMGYAALYSEALCIANKAGIAPATVNSVVSGGRMDCGFYQTFMKWTLERDPNAHRFAIANGNKDVRYLLSLADSVNAVPVVASAVKNVFAMAMARGGADDYVPMLADHVAAVNGTKLAD